MAVAAAETLIKQYQLVDNIADINFERDLSREQAWQKIEDSKSTTGGEQQPLAIDALSSAERVLALEDAATQEQYEDAYAGLVLDCQRLIGEWYRKNTWEYFPKSRHYFDKQAGEFYSHGFSIAQMTENALVDTGNKEENTRRVNERVEEETIRLLRSLGGAAMSGAVRTISECPDYAIDQYQQDKQTGSNHSGYNGYVPEIEKLMVRDITFDESSDDRFEEQVGISGKYITHEVIQAALHSKGAQTAGMDKTELHGSQMVANDDLIDFVQLLDETASEYWGINIFMGEELGAGQAKDYSRVRQESEERRRQLEPHAEELTGYIIDLARQRTDKRNAPKMVEDFVKQMLLGVARQDRQTALNIFDEQTADGLVQVALLEQIGQVTAAQNLFDIVSQEAPGGGYCGAGSCGLESVKLAGDAGKELKEKLKFENGDSVLKDTERKCKCGSKSIVYAFNAKKVNKYCEACGSFESKKATKGTS